VYLVLLLVWKHWSGQASHFYILLPKFWFISSHYNNNYKQTPVQFE